MTASRGARRVSGRPSAPPKRGLVRGPACLETRQTSPWRDSRRSFFARAGPARSFAREDVPWSSRAGAQRSWNVITLILPRGIRAPRALFGKVVGRIRRQARDTRARAHAAPCTTHTHTQARTACVCSLPTGMRAARRRAIMRVRRNVAGRHRRTGKVFRQGVAPVETVSTVARSGTGPCLATRSAAGMLAPPPRMPGSYHALLHHCAGAPAAPMAPGSNHPHAPGSGCGDVMTHVGSMISTKNEFASIHKRSSALLHPCQKWFEQMICGVA